VKNGGCLLSEYPAGTRGTRFTFPQRNRIVAGLTQGVVVIEAKIKSGSLGTARWAKKLGKPVFAVPGSIYSLNSGGGNELIRQGAILVRNADDILAALGHETATMQKPSLRAPIRKKARFWKFFPARQWKSTRSLPPRGWRPPRF